MLDVILRLFAELHKENRHMPPTILYKEGWLLRVILSWFSQNQVSGHLLSFMPGAEWYSEGLLSSKFLPAYRGDKLAESYTHADGVIGNIAVGGKGSGDIFLVEPFEQFLVLEAKLFSKLAGGTSRVSGYDQAARNIACMAGMIESSGCSMERFMSIGFHVLVPKSQIQKEAVHQKVRQRVEDYRGRSDYEDKRHWFEKYFEPLLDKIDVSLISWEIIIDSIGGYDKEMGEKLLEFYNLCCRYNKRTGKTGWMKFD